MFPEWEVDSILKKPVGMGDLVARINSEIDP